jgi:hypothetical protein
MKFLGKFSDISVNIFSILNEPENDFRKRKTILKYLLLKLSNKIINYNNLKYG